MMYQFMTLNDGTEIVHSDLLENEKVKVYVEKPDEKDCFHYMTCYLPRYELEDIYGFNEKEVEEYLEIIKSKTQLILDKIYAFIRKDKERGLLF